MSFGLRFELSVMMFLQYFVWGIWLPVLALHLGKTGLNLDGDAIGWVFSVSGFGSIVGPFIISQLADRYFATEKVMAACHFIGGLLLFLAAYLTTFWPIFICLLVYSTLYMPTMGLSNSLTFRAIGEGNQDAFPNIRLLGTVGWIAAGFFWTFYFAYAKDVTAFKPLFDVVGQPAFRDCLRVAAIVSIFYSLYCLILPHTPPVPANPTDSYEKKSAVAESLSLMKFPSFAVLVIVSGVIGVVLAFYFACEAPFLVHVGIDETKTSAFMTIGQIAEIPAMMLVPWTVARLGVKKTMLLGAGMWALRFVLSMIGQPQWLMISTIALHGFCFGFFFVVAQMYVDRAAAGDFKASAQNLLIFIIYGVGNIFGSVLSGRLVKMFPDDWTKIWAGPLGLTLLAIAAFALLFRGEELRKPAVVPELAD